MKLFYYIWNPSAKRDKRGKVINDISRRLASRRAHRLIVEGIRGRTQQKDYTTGGRKYKVGIKGNVKMRGEDK